MSILEPATICADRASKRGCLSSGVRVGMPGGGPPHPLVVGEAVKVVMGRVGLEGLCEIQSGQDRVFLRVKLLGGEVQASVPYRRIGGIKFGTSA